MSLQAVSNPHTHLSEESIQKIAAKLGGSANPQINSGTSELEAGLKLGVQLVFNVLRTGWGTHNQ
ncbi:hypothetical protein [Stenotrophomonas phage StenM_174]|uniref:Uncharacterized protein n=3 Tax=Ponderosavirus TaxID=3424921 RepID=A0AAE7WMD2_9CAUD|nr:hypothetical protein CPT_Ponderosa_033 [Stenotrophomonas phage Ponderosa]QYW01982.1 hypothetical protein CPT_Pepon032 [Stenotrophomonas phage Pepon]WPK42340.1 hypothetical protein [Stenotrophomonas phage StenM_174]